MKILPTLAFLAASYVATAQRTPIISENVEFNPTTEIRHIVQKSFYEGIQDLIDIAKTKPLEEAYLYVPKLKTWYEVGTANTVRMVEGGSLMQFPATIDWEFVKKFSEYKKYIVHTHVDNFTAEDLQSLVADGKIYFEIIPKRKSHQLFRLKKKKNEHIVKEEQDKLFKYSDGVPSVADLIVDAQLAQLQESFGTINNLVVTNGTLYTYKVNEKGLALQEKKHIPFTGDGEVPKRVSMAESLSAIINYDTYKVVKLTGRDLAMYAVIADRED